MPWDFSMYGRQIQADQNDKQNDLYKQKITASGTGGATLMAAQRLMQENPALSFADAYSIAKSGLGQGIGMQGGQVNPLTGALDSAAAMSGAKQTGENISDYNWKPRTAAKTESDKLKAESGTKAAIDLPKAESQAAYMNELLEGLKSHKGMAGAVGVKGPAQLWGAMDTPFSGTDEADFISRLEQVGGKQFLEAFESLKGGGAITQVEGEKATQAIARMQRSQTEAEFVRALTEFQGIVKGAIKRQRDRANGWGNANFPPPMPQDQQDNLNSALDEIKNPPVSGPGLQPVDPAGLPEGAVFIGTKNGRKVYRLPNGKGWME